MKLVDLIIAKNISFNKTFSFLMGIYQMISLMPAFLGGGNVQQNKI